MTGEPRPGLGPLGRRLLAAFVPLDLALVVPVVQLIRRKRAWAGAWVRVYLDVRLAVVLLLALLAPIWFFVQGPLPPRALAFAGLYLLRRCLVAPTDLGVRGPAGMRSAARR